MSVLFLINHQHLILFLPALGLEHSFHVEPCPWVTGKRNAAADSNSGRDVQGQARVNFGHAVVLLGDATDAHSRVAAARMGVGSTLSRRELALAGNVLEEGRLLVIALNKADALDPAARASVLDALNQQVQPSTSIVLMHHTPSTASSRQQSVSSQPHAHRRLWHSLQSGFLAKALVFLSVGWYLVPFLTWVIARNCNLARMVGRPYRWHRSAITKTLADTVDC